MPLNAKQVIEMSKESLLYASEAARQAEIEDRINMLQDDWADQIKSKIRKKLSDESYAKMINFIDISENPLKILAHDLAGLYVKPPRREFTGSSEYWENLYEEAGINDIMGLASELLQVTNDIGLRPVWRNEMTAVDIITPNVATVLVDPEDPLKMVQLMLKRRYDPRDTYTISNTYWVVWTEENHYIVSDKTMWTPSPVPGTENNEDMLNPYAPIIPIVFIHMAGQYDTFWNTTTGRDLVNMNLNVGEHKTLDGFTRLYNSFKQPVITGRELDVPSGIVVSPDTAMKITGDEVNVQLLDWMADLDALRKDRSDDVDRIFQQRGVQDTSFQASEVSGRALLIRNAKLTRNRIKQEKRFLKAEQQLFELIQMVDTYNRTGALPKKFEEVKISFENEEVIADPKDRLEIQLKEIEAGLKSKIDVFIERNPDYKNDREGAMEKLKEIEKENNELAQIKDSVLTDALNSEV